MLMRHLARVVVRHRIAVLVVAAILLPVAGVFGAPVAKHLSSGGFDDPGAESTRAAKRLEEVFGTGPPNVVFLVTAVAGTVDDTDVSDRGLALTTSLEGEEGVDEALSYWSLGSPPPLRSEDGTRALVLARVSGGEDAVREVSERIAPKYAKADDVVDVRIGGAGEVFRQITELADADLKRAELITTPITVVLLVVVFGSAVAAGLPLAVGVLAVLGTMLFLRLLAGVTEVSIFALNLTTAMGLGLAIDYSLFVVSRFREEMARGIGVEAAIVRTLHTAGKTIAFSAMTVALSLSALLVFPLTFLRSFGYAGIGVVAMAGLAAVVVVPAILAVLGPRIDKGVLLKARARDGGQSFWYAQAKRVMRYPLPIAVAVTVVLVAVGLPFLRIQTGLSDDRVLPEGAPARAVHDLIRSEFPSNEANALSVVAMEAVDPSARGSDVDAYAAALSAVEGVSRVDASTGHYAGGRQLIGPTPLSQRFAKENAVWLSVVPGVEALSPRGERLVAELRAVPAPFDVGIAGPSAGLVDVKRSISSRLPLAIAIIAITTFVLLFLMVGSLLVPLKALGLNMLSLTATFGALVYVFQDGNLAGLLGFTPTGTIPVYTPVLLFCIAFGLSMDYEVFLLSRMKEEYDLTLDNEASVAAGLEKTGRIVTAAALLLALVVGSFVIARVSVVKVFGLGMALAVLVDAFLIRATLVPAFMAIAGRANWWAPRPLRRLHLRIGIWEQEEPIILGAPPKADDAPPPEPAPRRTSRRTGGA